LTITTTSTTDVNTVQNGLAVYHVMGDFDMAAAVQSKVVGGTTTTSEYTLYGGYSVTKGTKLYAGVLSLGATGGAGDLIALGFTTSF
jgi:hypothetical protein